MAERKITFGTNLKALRKKAGLTRAALAEKISYSEKSIEKWEASNSMPPVNTLCLLADILKVSVDNLLYSKSSKINYLLGIDGGGTKTEFLLCDINGNEKKRIILSCSNPVDIGMEKTKDILNDGIRQITDGIDISEISMFAGLAGGISGDNQKRLEKFFGGFGFGSYSNASDTASALECTLCGKNGIAVIMGTGIIAFAQKDGERKRIGGWGYLIDKGGSGYNFGADALDCAFKYLDSRGGSKLIAELLQKELGKDLPSCVPAIHAGGKKLIASFAKVVFEAYEKNDEYAKEIIESNVTEVAKIIKSGLEFTGNNVPIIICGGLANKQEILKPFFNKYLGNDIEINFYTEPMVNGAVALAKKEIKNNA